MRIYTRIVINLKTNEVKEAEWTDDYNGPVALAKGGGGSTSTTSVDYAYNARMATISEKQQRMADEYFKFWQDEYKEMEQMQIEANKYLMPAQVDLQQESYKQALRSLDPTLIEREARVDVGLAFEGAQESMRREMGRLGIDPSSKKGMAMMEGMGLDKARAEAYAMKDTLTMTKEGGTYESGAGGFAGLWEDRLAAEEEAAGLPTPDAAAPAAKKASTTGKTDLWKSPTGAPPGSALWNAQWQAAGKPKTSYDPLKDPSSRAWNRMYSGGK